MAIRPNILSTRSIRRSADGFYKGFNLPVAFGSMAVVVSLILWILLFPRSATTTLSLGRELTLSGFRGWYVYALAGFVAFCVVVVCLPVSGRIRLGPDTAEPDFSTGSWLSMMFCAGIGAGVLIYAVAEPLAHFQSNPMVLAGDLVAGSPEAAVSALSYTYLHWGLSAWSCYAVLGLAVALYSHRYGMPLTIRTALAPLLGKRYGAAFGNIIDIFSIVAIVTGVATTLGYGVAQFVSGAAAVTGIDGRRAEDGEPQVVWQLAALGLAAIVATGSVVSGLGRGIKWLSNLSTGIFFLVLATFALIAGSGASLARYGAAIRDYLFEFPVTATLVANNADALADWQTDWTIFYWAWWIAFAPFVALFLARVSRGRTLRAFVLGCMFIPVTVCTLWFAFVAGAALDWQLAASVPDLSRFPISAQIYETFRAYTGGITSIVGNSIIALLMLMLLITTMNAAILAINTIAAGGVDDVQPKGHVILWGSAVTIIIGALVTAGGTDSIRDAMILGALPFSFVIALSAVSVTLSLIFEASQQRN